MLTREASEPVDPARCAAPGDGPDKLAGEMIAIPLQQVIPVSPECSTEALDDLLDLLRRQICLAHFHRLTEADVARAFARWHHENASLVTLFGK